jgi:hypothetical protein
MKISGSQLINTSSFFSIMLITLMALLPGCKGGDDPTPKELTTQKLIANTWKISTVSVDGVDQTALFTNMTLTFTATRYTTTNGGVVWPASGSWSYTDNTAQKIKRDDNVEVTLTEVSETALKMTLTWAQGTFGSGRVSSVAGQHVFTMVK